MGSSTRTRRPGRIVRYWTKGDLLHHLGRYEEALACYERGLATLATYPTADAPGYVRPMRGWFWRAKVATLRALGWESEAREADRQAKELGK